MTAAEKTVLLIRFGFVFKEQLGLTAFHQCLSNKKNHII